jgi:hypothetical protein
VKEEIENSRFSLLNLMNRFCTLPLGMMLFGGFPYDDWKDLDRRVVREGEKRQYAVDLSSSVRWSVAD